MSATLAGPWLRSNAWPLAERFLAIEPPRIGNRILEPGKTLPAAIRRAEDERAGLSEVPEQVVAAQACGGHDPSPRSQQAMPLGGAGRSACFFISRARPLSLRLMPRTARRPGAEAIARSRRQLHPPGQASAATRCRVPRNGQDRTISPASTPSVGLLGPRPQAHGPLDAPLILGLHGEHPADRIGRVAGRSRREAGPAQPAGGGQAYGGPGRTQGERVIGASIRPAIRSSRQDGFEAVERRLDLRLVLARSRSRPRPNPPPGRTGPTARWSSRAVPAHLTRLAGDPL